MSQQSSTKSSYKSDSGCKNLGEERRLSCSRTEFRPVHSEIIRRKLIQDFQTHGSLPVDILRRQIPRWRLEEGKERSEDSAASQNSLAEYIAKLENRRNSFPILSRKTGDLSSQDSGIGSSPPVVQSGQEEKTNELIFSIEM